MPSAEPHFSLSVPPSPLSSRCSSPVPSYHEHEEPHLTENEKLSSLGPDALRPSSGDVYDTTLPAWRAAIRRKILVCVERETPVIAKMQEHIRTPFFDAYFVYTSSLGTHTFFMTMLPAMFFFGYGELGRGLLLVLVFGVYFSSFVKDLICSPRPFAPPVTRLTIGSHHLEYGFPSTHSTNSVSLALFFFSIVHRFASVRINPLDGEVIPPALSPEAFYVLSGGLFFYTFSIVFGRLYTAMHSFTDCVAGCIMGASIWYFFDNWLGLGYHAAVERWLSHAGWEVPAIIVPLCLFLVHKHPQPVDDCPCFEDAIAFNSVMMGAMVSYWGRIRILDNALQSLMPGGSWSSWENTLLWWGTASIKMVFGVLVIFAWRIVAKSIMHITLPPFFRFLSFSGFVLPHRRFYTPATDYKAVPSENLGGLRAVPSVLDLPSTSGVEMEFDSDNDTATEVSGVGGPTKRGNDIKLRNGNGSSSVIPNGRINEKEWNEKTFNGGEDVQRTALRKHYDADVLTKVFVYCGIAVLACEALPLMFDAVGWGVKPW